MLAAAHFVCFSFCILFNLIVGVFTVDCVVFCYKPLREVWLLDGLNIEIK